VERAPAYGSCHVEEVGMTQDDARRGLEASTDFEFRSGRVWLRQVRWLRAAAELSAGDAIRAAACVPRAPFVPPAGRPRCPVAHGGWGGDRLS
jgi:hypothetical protein